MQAMTKPDRTLIAEVMLFSQGFSSAGKLSEKLVPLFKLCQEQLSPQSHYDFTLRALKSVLVSAGNVKRLKMKGQSGVRRWKSWFLPAAKPTGLVEADCSFFLS